MRNKRVKTAAMPRVYEYVDNDGVVFWSMTRIPFARTHKLRLVMPWGDRLRMHIRDLLNLAASSGSEEENVKGDVEG